MTWAAYDNLLLMADATSCLHCSKVLAFIVSLFFFSWSSLALTGSSVHICMVYRCTEYTVVLTALSLALIFSSSGSGPA